jgi:hypothetical protein
VFRELLLVDVRLEKWSESRQDEEVRFSRVFVVNFGFDLHESLIFAVHFLTRGQNPKLSPQKKLQKSFKSSRKARIHLVASFLLVLAFIVHVLNHQNLQSLIKSTHFSSSEQ